MIRWMVWALALTLALAAQPPVAGHQAWQTFGIQEGLGSLSIWCLVVDHQGLLWVGTEGGLLRFDGRRFERFGTAHGLPNASISALHVDSLGQLWVGTTAGLALRDGKGFRRPGGQAGEEGAIVALGSGTAGSLWVGTARGLWVVSNDRIMAPHPRWQEGQVSALAEVPGEEPWVALWSGRAGKVLRWRGDHWDSLAIPPVLAREPIDCMVRTRDGRLWARTLKDLWVQERGAMVPAPFPVEPVTQRTFLRTDADGALWLQSGGAVIRVGANGKRSAWSSGQLPNLATRTLYQDPEGTLWLGGGGLARRLGAGAWWRHGLAEGLPSEVIWTFFRDRDGQLHAGTDRGMATLVGGRWKPVAGTQSYQVRSIVQASDGSLLMTGSPHVLAWSPRRESMDVFGVSSGIRAGRRIFRLLVDPTGPLWVATEGEGLLRGNQREGRWDFVSECLPDGAPGETFEDLCLDAQGRVWAAGSRGLLLREKGQWRRFTTADGLKSNQITHVAPSADGSMLGSYGSTAGGFRFDYGAGRLQRLRALHPDLPSELVIYLLKEDHRGRVWIGTGTGAFVVHPTGSLERFTTEEGLAGDDINSQAFLADVGDTVWIGTSSGAACLDGTLLPPAPPPPRAWLQEFRVQGRAMAVDSGQLARFRRPDTAVEFSFLPGSLLPPSGLETQVRLLGMEAQWRSSDGSPEHFASLASGHYRFEVRSRRCGGDWGPIAAFSFDVLPAWWESPGARAGYGLTLTGLILLAHWGRVRLLRARNRRLQAMVHSATEDLRAREQIVVAQSKDLERINAELRELNGTLKDLNAQKTFFLGVAAHDLRNPINAIVLTANYLEGEVQDPELSRMAQTIAREGMEMSGLLGRLLDVAAIENGTLHAHLVPGRLLDVVGMAMQRLQAKAAAKSIRLCLEAPGALSPLELDARFVQEVLDNLMTNAIKFSPPGAEVRVLVEDGGTLQRVGIKDQGPGLTAEDKAQLFSRFKVLSARPTAGEKSNGLGLSIVKKLMDLMGGSVWAESEPGQGATFWVAFPATAPDSTSGPNAT